MNNIFLKNKSDENWWERFYQLDLPEKQENIDNKEKTTFNDLEKLCFYSEQKNLSQQIDKIVYGISR